MRNLRNQFRKRKREYPPPGRRKVAAWTAFEPEFFSAELFKNDAGVYPDSIPGSWVHIPPPGVPTRMWDTTTERKHSSTKFSPDTYTTNMRLVGYKLSIIHRICWQEVYDV